MILNCIKNRPLFKFTYFYIRVSAVAATVAAALGENFPTKEQCDEAPPLPQWDAFPTVFLPAENKGFQ